MSSCIFLLPNSLLSEEDKALLGDAVYPASMRELCKNFSAPTTIPIFANPSLSGLATVQWVWMTITKREHMIPVAPLLWEGLNGQRIDKEFWQLSPYFVTAEGTLESAAESFDLDEECFLRDILAPLLRQSKMEVQVLDGKFFLTRKTAWKVQACPWIAQQHKKPLECAGEEAEQWIELGEKISNALKGSEFNEYRKSAGRPIVDGLWISGGGFDTAIKDISFTRVIQTNSDLVRGICKASGINHKYITAEAAPWPDECPEGDRLSILSLFDNPAVRKDKKLWTKAWDDAYEIINHQLSTCKSIDGLEIYAPMLVASDGLRVSIISKPLKQKLLRFWKSEPDYTAQWITP